MKSLINSTVMEKVAIKPTKKVVSTSEEEKWRDSSVYPEIMVSSKGRIKAKDYRLVTKEANTDCFRIYNVPAKILEPRVGTSGDAIVSITKSNGVAVTESVAFLVAKEFVPNEDPSRYTKLKFRDLNRANTHPSNLYWDGVGPFAKK